MGPRAVVAEFLGSWVGTLLLIWSFTVSGRLLVWSLRGSTVAAMLLGVGLSVYFANTTEVPETTEKEPTGFKSDITSIHIE